MKKIIYAAMFFLAITMMCGNAEKAEAKSYKAGKFKYQYKGVSEREICEKVGLEQKELVKLKFVTGFAKIFKDYKYNAAIEKVVDERRVARETAKKKEDKK